MIRDDMGIIPINRHWYLPDVIARRKARRLFEKAYSRGRWRWLWSTLTRRSHRLLHLAEIEAGHQIESSIAAGEQLVPLDQIRGSVNRYQDFDDDFYPIQAHTQERWLRVAIAHQSGLPLPPVELIRVGDIYYVVDGHHRLSVARAVGQVDIEAKVKFIVNRRTKMTHTIFVESTAREKYQNLLQQAETYRQVQQLKAQQPGRLMAVLTRFGQALVTMGQKLQAGAKQKAAGSV